MTVKKSSVSALALILAVSTPAMTQANPRNPFEQARETVRQGREGGDRQAQRPERQRPERQRQEARQERPEPRGERLDRGRPDRDRPDRGRPDRGGGQRDAFEQARRQAERQQEARERGRGRDQEEMLARAQRASERQREDAARATQAARDSLRDRGQRERDRQERERDRWQDTQERQRDRWQDARDRQQDRREDVRDQLRERERWEQITRERDRERWERQREALERRQERDRDSWRYVQAWQGRDITYLIRDRNYGSINGCPPGLAWRNNGCLPPGQARRLERERQNWWWSSNYNDDNRWRYYDGYAYREERRDNGLASVFIPLLAGALGINNPWPQQYAYEPAPTYYRTYYGLNDRYDYRYADGVIYGVDRGGNRIERVSALLVGDPWTVGQRMPVGYDVYNVPYDYRDRYRDRDDRWYRYSDGYVYEVDPTTRLVQSVIQLIA